MYARDSAVPSVAPGVPNKIRKRKSKTLTDLRRLPRKNARSAMNPATARPTPASTTVVAIARTSRPPAGLAPPPMMKLARELPTKMTRARAVNILAVLECIRVIGRAGSDSERSACLRKTNPLA